MNLIEQNIKSQQDQKMRIKLFDAFLSCSEKIKDLNKQISEVDENLEKIPDNKNLL